MRIKFLLVLILICVSTSYSQQYQYYPEQFRDFTIKSPTHKQPNSLYRRIKIVDLRKDSLRMGIGQFGLLNKRLTITPNPYLWNQ